MQNDPSLTDEQATARAEKQCGYGMVSRVAVPGGTEDWFGACNASIQLNSL